MKQEEKTKLTRKRIIEAAINEFGTKGYEKANINTISGAGIAKGLIYHNFSGKDELYVECLRVCFDEMTKALACPGSIADHTVYFDKRIAFFRERRTVAVMVLEALIDPPIQHIEIISEIRKQYDKINSEWIMKILSSGSLREDVSKEKAMKYLALMQDMFNWYCSGRGSWGREPEEMIEMHERELPGIFEYMVYGIMKGD
ncbi:MAG: TetR/AcrR family transcriptional regulator [Oscillospiraceae bacterium]|nr:TetR/AcrR family transcriptional regulator [Oscillospiraceae bacterium]